MKELSNKDSRREFIKKNVITGVGAALGIGAISASSVAANRNDAGIPAILGGAPVLGVQQKPTWPKWPVWNAQADEPQVLEAIRSGVWSRAAIVTQFENEWAKLMGSGRCVTTVNGTNALIAALVNLDVGGGDEVIIPPYTFIATPQAVLQTGAIPVFADIDLETFQIDPKKIEEKITPRTKAILPVHIAGLPADMESIMKIARKHNLVVVEDACQSWLSEINHKKVGTFGDAGCFSFQNSKNIPIGEAGAIISDNEEFIDRCYSYHNFGMAYGSLIKKYGPGPVTSGTKLRITEYQAAIGLAQLKRFNEQTTTRSQNAAYLKSKMEEIAGIIPYKVYKNVTRVSFHLFPFRYKKEEFKGLDKAGFLKALNAEGVPCSGGYAPLNDKPFLHNTFQSKNFKKMYSADQLDFEKYKERNRCPQNDILCNEAVWFTQNMLLGPRSDMDYIISAITKIKTNAEAIKKSLKA